MVPTAAPVKRHVVAAVALTPQGPRVLARRAVDGPPQLDRAPRQGGWRVLIEDDGGAVLHSAHLEPVRDIRGEFPGEDGKLEGVRIPDPEPVVTLRLPDLPKAARVRILDERPVLDGQGKVQEGQPRATVAELRWAEVAP